MWLNGITAVPRSTHHYQSPSAVGNAVDDTSRTGGTTANRSCRASIIAPVSFVRSIHSTQHNHHSQRVGSINIKDLLILMPPRTAEICIHICSWPRWFRAGFSLKLSTRTRTIRRKYSFKRWQWICAYVIDPMPQRAHSIDLRFKVRLIFIRLFSFEKLKTITSKAYHLSADNAALSHISRYYHTDRKQHVIIIMRCKHWPMSCSLQFICIDRSSLAISFVCFGLLRWKAIKFNDIVLTLRNMLLSENSLWRGDK